MKQLRLLAASLLAFGANAWADVGMITQISGEVGIVVAGKAQKAVPFLKIEAGDKLTLPNGARVQLVYFSNGRQELWNGAVQVEVGSLESKSAGKPEVKQLPPLVVNQLAKTPVAGQQGKTGMVRVRSLMDPDAGPALEKQYTELKKNAGVDVTPEVFLLSGLIEIKEFTRAREVLSSLEGKSVYQPVVDHFAPIVKAAGK